MAPFPHGHVTSCQNRSRRLARWEVGPHSEPERSCEALGFRSILTLREKPTEEVDWDPSVKSDREIFVPDTVEWSGGEALMTNMESNKKNNLQHGKKDLDELATKIDLHLQKALKSSNAEGGQEDKDERD